MRKTKEKVKSQKAKGQPREQVFAIGVHRFKVPHPTPKQVESLKKVKGLLDGLPEQLTNLVVGATAVNLLQAENRELRRQVRILRAEMRCQQAMWKDAEAGKRNLLEMAIIYLTHPDRWGIFNTSKGTTPFNKARQGHKA